MKYNFVSMITIKLSIFFYSVHYNVDLFFFTAKYSDIKICANGMPAFATTVLLY